MSSAQEVKIKVDKIIKNINQQIISRGVRVGNVLRNAELEVLSGQRSGKVYRKPGAKTTYTASAPGEVPARRSGNLRKDWNYSVEPKLKGGNQVEIISVAESVYKYSKFLDEGTKKMEARPFKDEIIEKAMPEIKEILEKPYN